MTGKQGREWPPGRQGHTGHDRRWHCRRRRLTASPGAPPFVLRLASRRYIGHQVVLCERLGGRRLSRHRLHPQRPPALPRRGYRHGAARCSCRTMHGAALWAGRKGRLRSAPQCTANRCALGLCWSRCSSLWVREFNAPDGSSPACRQGRAHAPDDVSPRQVGAAGADMHTKCMHAAPPGCVGAFRHPCPPPLPIYLPEGDACCCAGFHRISFRLLLLVGRREGGPGARGNEMAKEHLSGQRGLP